MHKPPSELHHTLEVIRNDPATPVGDPRRVEAHRELAAQCPAFVPNLLALSRSMLLNTQEPRDPSAYFTEAVAFARQCAPR